LPARARQAGAPVISGDPVLAERLIANLVDNAVRYNAAPGDIWISTRTAAGSAQLTVANTGPVISPAHAGRIFQPLQRAEALLAWWSGHRSEVSEAFTSG
jgi:signal transduction histidine kinase